MSHNIKTPLTLLKGAAANTIAFCDVQKNTYDASQLWYFASQYIICNSNGMVLTIKGGHCVAGTEVVMEPLAHQPVVEHRWETHSKCNGTFCPRCL